MKILKRKLTAYLLTLAVLLGVVPISGNAAGTEDLKTPDNGIPLLIINIDEDAGGDYKTISEMNASLSKIALCTGTVEVKIPEGYKSEYGDYEVPDEPLKLDYIRGRGNTTWTDSVKKPYKLKFDKKTDFFGMGECKTWELIANAFDPTLIKNRITYYLGAKMGMPYTPQCVPVEVVMKGKNGSEYLGTYCLTEGVKVEKNRVGIAELDKDDSDISGDANITGGYLLSFYSERQNADESPSTVFTTKGGQTLINDTPSYASEDALTAGEKAQREYIRNYIQELEDLILTEGEIDKATHDKIADMMDLQSVADYWWINEFAENGDAYGTDSAFLYKDRNGKLCFGPLWDFDSAWGEPGRTDFEESDAPSGFTETDCIWINALRDNDPEFRKILLERWEVCDKALQELARDGGVIDQYANEVAASQKADVLKWKAVTDSYMGTDNYEGVVDFLKKSIISRRNFCAKNIEWVPYKHANAIYEVDGEQFYKDKMLLWSYFSEPDKYPTKDGYVFKGWVEKESKIPLDEYYPSRDTTFVAEFVASTDATAPEGLFLSRYEDWIPVSEDLYEIYSEVYPEDATSTRVTLTSSNESVASVINHKRIKINGSGDVTITVKTYNGLTKSILLHVYDDKSETPVSVTGIKLDKTLITMKKGEYVQPLYTLTPNGILKENSVSLESDKPSVVDVDSSGVLIAKKDGTAVITCSVFDESFNEVGSEKLIVNVGNTGSKKNTLSVKAKTVTLSYKKLSKNKISVAKGKALKITKAKGSVTYALTSASKKITINRSSGKLTFAKGLKKGTYKVKVLVNASGDKTYAPANKTVTIKVIVK